MEESFNRERASASAKMMELEFEAVHASMLGPDRDWYWISAGGMRKWLLYGRRLNSARSDLEFTIRL